MPFIRITTFGTDLNPAQIKRLQDVTTELMATVMRKPLVGIAVLVEAVKHGGWSIAGVPQRIAAQVEATIGAGQNTPEEKAEFMAGMMAVLKEVIGSDLGESTYISFFEFPFDAYGRGGLTRAARERAANAA
jgi:4-oxalocrotonate tautomerase